MRPLSVINLITKLLWIIFGLGVLVLGIVLMLVGFNLKHVAAVYQGINQGKTSLESALTLAKTSDFAQANASAKEAVSSFSNALSETQKIKLGPFGYIPLVAVYKSDAEHLVSAGQSLAEAMNSATAYANDLGSVISAKGSTSFSQLPLTERQRILSTIYNADTTLNSLHANLEQSLSDLKGIKSFTWFGPLSTRLEELSTKIVAGKTTLEEASPLTRLLPPLLGYPNTAHYLLVLQNSDELRPTGGFIGTYGIIQTKDGDFERFETHDIYHIDIPIQDKINVIPPDPIKKYLVPKWYMRDANWSPDWPTSAEKIAWFYKLENAALPKPDPLSDFDGVIAITPEFITSLMKLTGPVVLNNTTYTAENFVDLLQYKVEKDYVRLGVPSWQRKEVVGDIAKVIKQRLLDLPLNRWSELIQLVSDNVARKSLLLYSRDPSLQKLIIDQGWGGQVRQDWGDYLMVVDANLAALKTDAVMDRQINYSLTEGTDGLTAKLVLRYSHGGHYDWKTSNYRSYTRVYVPAGSRLIKATGFTQGDVTVGNELNKTYFGAFIEVKPGQIGELSFEYELPSQVLQNMKTYKNYRLVVQKQPGKQVNKLAVDVAFKNKIKSYSPASFYSEASSPSQLKAEGDLTIDRSFLVNF